MNIGEILFTLWQKLDLKYYLDFIIEYCILAVVFFLPLSVNATSIFLVLSFILWIIKMLLQKKLLFRRNKYDYFVLFYILLSAFSILFSPDRSFSLYNFLYLMSRYILIYYLVINNVNSGKQLKKLICAMIFSAIFVTIFGFYQYLNGINMDAFDWVDVEKFPNINIRIFSTLDNPNILAVYLVMMIALVGGLWFKNNVKILKYLLFFIGILMSICLVYTYSRGAWLSIIIISFIFIIMYNKQHIWLLLIVSLFSLFFHNTVQERLLSILNPTDTSTLMRISFWKSTLAMIVAKPFFGIGWGAYWLVYPEYGFYINDLNTIIFHAHNTYLHIAAEIGIPGLLIFISFSWLHLRDAKFIFKKNSKCWLGGLMLGLINADIGLAINGLTDHVLFNGQLCMLFWLNKALIIVACRNDFENSNFKN